MSQKPKKDTRLIALRRFAASITFFNLLGHTVLGFEQSWMQPIVGIITAYFIELLLEYIFARTHDLRPRFAGGFTNLVHFLLPAHISGLAISMLLYANDRLWPIAFAVAVAIGSKFLFRVSMGKGSRHFLNPSNFGIAVTLLVFPWIGIAPPYHYTTNLTGAFDWALPFLILILGSTLNIKLTRKLPLILAWVGAFVAQAVIRNLFFDAPLIAALLPMTGTAFLLFTFYMITDPGTTPFDTQGQIWFGIAVAVVYGFLVVSHIVFGFFFALTIVSALRGLALYAQNWSAKQSRVPIFVPTPTIQGKEAS